MRHVKFYVCAGGSLRRFSFCSVFLVTYFCHLHFWLAESDAVSIDVTQQVRIKQAQTQGESLALIQVEM